TLRFELHPSVRPKRRFPFSRYRQQSSSRQASIRISSMHDDKIAFSNNQSVFISQRRRTGFDQAEQPVPSRSDVRAVLDIVRRPKLFSGRIVTTIDRCVLSCPSGG